MNVENIPYNYVHCYATKKQCKKSENCLRHNAACMNEKKREKPELSPRCVTAAYISRITQGETCTLFRDNKCLRYAKGMKYLFDDVPKGKYASVRMKVIKCFSCERVFYYALKGKQYISPTMQEKIMSVFKEENLSLPLFDRYEMLPDW